MPSLQPERPALPSAIPSRLDHASDNMSLLHPLTQYPPVGDGFQGFCQASMKGKPLDCLHPSEGLSPRVPKASSSLPPHSSGHGLLKSRQREILQEQFNTLIKKGALEPVPISGGPGFPFTQNQEIPPGVLQRAINQFRALSFGLRLAPWLFTLVVGSVPPSSTLRTQRYTNIWTIDL